MRLDDKTLNAMLLGVHKPSTLSDALLDLQEARRLLKQIVKSPAFFRSNYTFPYSRREKVLELLGMKSTAIKCLTCKGKGFNYEYSDHAHLPSKPRCEGCSGTGKMRVSLAVEDKEVIVVERNYPKGYFKCPDCEGRLAQIESWRSIDEDLECNKHDHRFFLISSSGNTKMIKR